jgi:hypothetical protein
MEDENWTRLSMSDKIRRFDRKAIHEPEPIREPETIRDREPYWSLSEAMDIGTSILALMEREVASQVE